MGSHQFGLSTRMRTKNRLIAGFYREWTLNGENSEESQLERIEIFNNQMEKANEKDCHLLIMWDANLCSLNEFRQDMQLKDKLFIFDSILGLCVL